MPRIGGQPFEAWSRALAAAAILGGPAAARALARIGGPAGVGARQAVAGWQALGRDERVRATAAMAAAARAPIPGRRGVGRVHQGWIDGAVGDDARAAAGWRGRRGDAVGVWWQRRVAAPWVELPAEDAAAGADLAAWPVARLDAAVRRVGLAVIAHATLDAGETALARIAAGLPGDDGATFIAVARRLRGDGPLRAALGPARAAAACATAHDGDVARIGAAVVGRAVVGDLGVQVRLVLGPELAGRMDGDSDGLAIEWETLRAVIGS